MHANQRWGDHPSFGPTSKPEACREEMGEAPHKGHETGPDAHKKDGGVPEFTWLSSSLKLVSDKEWRTR